MFDQDERTFTGTYNVLPFDVFSVPHLGYTQDPNAF
jgi:hypothetical protein